jgi:hypothetical protein
MFSFLCRYTGELLVVLIYTLPWQHWCCKGDIWIKYYITLSSTNHTVNAKYEGGTAHYSRAPGISSIFYGICIANVLVPVVIIVCLMFLVRFVHVFVVLLINVFCISFAFHQTLFTINKCQSANNNLSSQNKLWVNQGHQWFIE